MKKLLITLATVALLAACNVTVTPIGPQPGTKVTVGDDDGAAVTIPAGKTHRFELEVAASPVRVDVGHKEATANKELYVKALDKDDSPYAHTDARDYFQDASVPLAEASSVASQNVNISLPYSLNLPKNMGKVYIEVTNNTVADATVTVKAVERNEILRQNEELEAPPSGGFSGKSGAILFLGQHDTYVYTGSSNQQIVFDVADPANPIALKAILNKGKPSETELERGVSINLLPDDVVEVFANNDARAGFCNNQNLDGCTDGITSGEYTLTVK